MSGRFLTGLFLVVLVVGAVAMAGYAFVQKNQGTELILDLYFAAWRLRPEWVPAAIGVAFAVGFAIGALLFAGKSMRLARRLRSLEQQVALGAGGERGEWR